VKHLETSERVMERAVDAPGCYRLKDETEISALLQSAKQIVRSIQTFHVWLPSLAASRLESCGMSGNERNSLSHGERAGVRA
jgi:hypothetical protein